MARMLRIQYLRGIYYGMNCGTTGSTSPTMMLSATHDVANTFDPGYSGSNTFYDP